MPDTPNGPPKLRRFGATLIASSALVLGAVACGDDDESSGEESESASAEEVTVTAEEYTFDLSATPAADTKSVVFDNQGQEFHALIFARINEGFTVEEAIKLQGEKGSATILAESEAEPGKSATVEIKKSIEPGSYAMLCPLSGPEGEHSDLGQLEEFDIE